MSRNRNIPGSLQAALAKEFFEDICRGDLQLLSFKGVADHITQKTGVRIKEYSVRRCPEVREYYDSLKENTEPNTFKNLILFKSLDIDAFLEHNNNIIALKLALSERDEYYSLICNSASKIADQVMHLTEENRRLKMETEKLQEEISQLSTNNKQSDNEIRELQLLVAKLRDILEKNVNESVAVELLKGIGLLKSNGHEVTIKEVALEQFVLSPESSIIRVIEEDKRNYEDKVIQGLFDKI